MEDELNILVAGRQPKKIIMQPSAIEFKTMVAAPLRVTYSLIDNQGILIGY